MVDPGKLTERIELGYVDSEYDPESGSTEDVWIKEADRWAEAEPVTIKLSDTGGVSFRDDEFWLRFRRAEVKPDWLIYWRGATWTIEGIEDVSSRDRTIRVRVAYDHDGEPVE